MPSGPEQAVAALAEWEGVGAEQYDEMINRMSVADVALPGSLVHVAGPVANGWRVFDVWESPEALDRFRRGTLMPILEQAGFPIPKVWTRPAGPTSPWWSTLPTYADTHRRSKRRSISPASRPCRTRRSTRRHPDCAFGYANEMAGSRSPSRTTAWDSIPSLNRELAASRTSPTGSRLQEGRYRSGRRPGRGPP